MTREEFSALQQGVERILDLLEIKQISHNELSLEETKMVFTLRTERFMVYKDLWKCLKPLGRYPKFGPVSYKELTQVSECLSTWYHGGGGLFLSQSSRYCYDAVQRKIAEVVKNKNVGELVPSETLDDIASGEARELRAALAKDVGTRTQRRPFASSPG